MQHEQKLTPQLNSQQGHEACQQPQAMHGNGWSRSGALTGLHPTDTTITAQRVSDPETRRPEKCSRIPDPQKL